MFLPSARKLASVRNTPAIYRNNVALTIGPGGKACLEFRGRTFLEHVCEAVAARVPEVIVVAAPGMAKDADKKGTKPSSHKKTQESWEWSHGAEEGRSKVAKWKQSVRDKDHPQMTKFIYDDMSKVAGVYLGEVEKCRRYMSQQKAAWGKISPDSIESLQRIEDLYNGYMSEAGPYLR